MAKLIKKPSALKEDYLRLKRKQNKALLFMLLFVALAVLGSVLMNNERFYTFGLILLGLSVLGFIICIIFINATQNALAIKKQGVDGEDLTADILRDGLDDSYTVFQNSVITFEGKISELDLIVVGENGVFVIEAKNRGGTVVGGYNKDKWTQYKIGQKGGEYSSDFYSPVKQVSTHIFRLAGYLRQNGAPTHIDGAVYFANEDAKIEISGKADKIPVLCQKKELIKLIKKNNNHISRELAEKICHLLII